MIQLGQEAHNAETLTSITLDINLATLSRNLAPNKSPAFFVRAKLSQAFEILDKKFWQGACVTGCMQKRAALIDSALSLGWQWYGLHEWPICLVAVGGYGREDLHPHSDADILVLSEASLKPKQDRKIEHFIAYCWDCGLNVGHSVRSLTQCQDLATQDFTIFSNLLDARLIIGDSPLFEQLHHYIFTIARKEIPLEFFFKWKLKERETRYQRFGDTEYTLEPNLKECPGGLRDIQLLGLLTKREFGTHDLVILTTIGFITIEEKEALYLAQYTLWQIRYALHLSINKREDRLFLEYQEKLARQFGFHQTPLNEAISSFMMLFFRSIRKLREITSVLFQHFRELYQDGTYEQTPLNTFAKIQNQSICITDERHLQQHPEKVLLLFEALAQRPQLRGFVARSTRFIINFYQGHPLKATTLTRPLFLKLFNNPQGTAKVLRLMARFGLLSQYCPEFESIIGQMQYDLYHVYTVDAHILNMLEQIQNFYVKSSEIEFVSRCLKNIDPLCLYLGALFHDIGKGKGGNHSLIGCEIANHFCQSHHLDASQTDMISWLVKEHLLLSNTARTKDLSSPDVISNFCAVVKSQKHLAHLYVLTIADILATNPTLWNKWHATLLKNLYLSAQTFLGDPNDIGTAETIQANQELALSLLEQDNFNKEKIKAIWQDIGDEYFQIESPETIAWHTRELYQTLPSQYPIVVLAPHPAQGGTEIFIFAPDRIHLFALCAATLDKLQLSVVQARIITSKDNYCLNTFVVLESSDEPICGPQRKLEIQNALKALLKPLMQSPATPPQIPLVSHRIRRHLKFFKDQAKVTISNSETPNLTVLVVLAPDFPGLLARVGEAFIACDIFLKSAKINTLGKRVEDVFYIVDRQTGRAITDTESMLRLKSVILDKLSDYWT